MLPSLVFRRSSEKYAVMLPVAYIAPAPGSDVVPTDKPPADVIRIFSDGAEFIVDDVENVNIPVGYCAFVLAPKIQEIIAEEYWFVLAPVMAAKFNCAVLLVVVSPLAIVIAAVLPFNVVLESDF